MIMSIIMGPWQLEGPRVSGHGTDQDVPTYFYRNSRHSAEIMT